LEFELILKQITHMGISIMLEDLVFQVQIELIWV